MGRWVGVLLASLALCSAEAKSHIIPAAATAFQVSDGNLLVGTTDGGVALYEAETGKRLLSIAGDGNGPTKDIRLIEGHPWWCQEGDPIVHTLNSDLRTVSNVNVGIDAVDRLCAWKDKVVACSAKGFRFIDAATHRVLRTADVLPKDIADQTTQGTVATSWSNGHGILTLIRRYGKRKDAKQDEIADIALVNAWSDDYKLLGGYTCSIVPFKDVDGPDVRIRIGSTLHESPAGQPQLGNLAVSSDGLVALGKSEILAVPFSKQDWEAQHVSVPLDPAYSQSLFQTESTVWWTDGAKLYRSSLEDGATDVFIQKTRQPVTIMSIRGDSNGTWALCDGGILRVDSHSFVQYTATANASKPTTPRRSRLYDFIHSKAAASQDFIGKALKAAGCSSRLPLEKLPDVSDSMAYGDVVLNGSSRAIYVGGGLVQDSTAAPHPLVVTEETKIVRPLVDLAAPLAEGSPENLGLGAPSSLLGNDRFVEITHDTQFDQPYLPIHQQMADEMQRWIGTPYKWGGNDQSGVDCSGFVCAIFRSVGINLPRYSQDIGRAKVGLIVQDQLKWGDVLVYSWPHEHCAIYVGNGQVVEAVSGGVQQRSISHHPFGIVRRFITGESYR